MHTITFYTVYYYCLLYTITVCCKLLLYAVYYYCMLYSIALYCILLLYAVYYYCILTSYVLTYIHLPLSVLLTLLVYAWVCSVLDWCSCINRAHYKGSLLVQRQLAAFKGGDHDVKIDVLSETHSLIALQGTYIHTLCLHNLERHPLLCHSLWSHWLCYRQRMEQAAWAVCVCTYIPCRAMRECVWVAR